MSRPRHHVIATAGHVDHGKSTLVRALTGTDPDRLVEERRRGLTIDLGFAWTTLPSGADVAFVDVPGHERFIATMLAGLGPVPVVCFVVAADEGWRAQSGEHRDALVALGIEHGVVVISRADLAPDNVEAVTEQVRRELADTGLHDAPLVCVSATTGLGLDALRAALDDVLARVPAAADEAPLRLWVDRCFSITGAGTVVTGTLAGGTLLPELSLERLGERDVRTVKVRGLQHHGQPVESVQPVSRVAVNLRGLHTDEAQRGDVLITPGAWWLTDTLDVGRVSGPSLREAPEQLVVHVGTAAVAARLRPFDDDHARLTLTRQLPLRRLDRLVLRHPGTRRVLGGVRALDVEPPSLRRRGDGRRRAASLALEAGGRADAEVARRGAVRAQHLRLLGVPLDPASVPHTRSVGDWLVSNSQFESWTQQLADLVRAEHDAHPISAGVSVGAAVETLGLPDPQLLTAVSASAGATTDGRHVYDAQRVEQLGAAERPLAALEQRLRENPFAAPEADDLEAWGLGARELAAAERLGRVLRLDGGIVLLPTAPALAMRELAALEQPFTTSAARQALGTTRRVAIPLLEHLDARGWTHRVDANLRAVRR